MPEKITEDQCVLLPESAWNAVVVTLNALYSERFQNKGLNEVGVIRDLANFLQANLDNNHTVEDWNED